MNLKKGSIWINMILGIFIIAIVFSFMKPMVNWTMDKFFGENGTIFKSEFEPYEEIFKDEEKVVVDSMTALITAINSIAKGERVESGESKKISSNSLAFDSYEISFSSNIDLEERWGNDKREWAFSKRFNANQEEMNSQGDNKVFADYYYSSCDNSNKGTWVDCNGGSCYCNDEDEKEDGYRAMENLGVQEELISKARESNLAPIRDIITVYNIELVTYQNGREICRVGTYDQSKKLTDTSKKDLLVWGVSNEDRDGDGIRGAYAQDLVGKPYEEALTAKEKNALEQSGEAGKEKINKYFPKGIIENGPYGGIGENCLDSPTWLECPGMRIYYCGKYGFKSGAAQEESKYYFEFDKDGSMHSRAGIRLLRTIDPQKFTNQQSSINRVDEKANLEIRDAGSRTTSTFMEGTWNYARDYDVDILLSGAGLIFKETDDPTVFCHNGKKIGKTEVEYDPNFGAANVCNFELPQNIEKGYDSALSWFAGYGDPKYVVYYEAFPSGEDESWHVEPLSLGLQSAFLINMGLSVGVPIGGAAIKQGGKLLKLTGKMLKGVVLPGTIIKAIKTGSKGIYHATVKTTSFAFDLAQRTGTFLKAGFTKGGKAVLKETMEDAVGQGIKMVSNVPPSVLKDLQLDDVAGKHILRQFKSEAGYLADSIGELGFKGMIEKGLVNNPAMQKELLKELTKKGIVYSAAFYSAAAMAREDSMNQKFLPLGVNEIGVKEPYKGAFVTGEQLPALDPSVEKYIIQLRKDKYKGGALTNVILNQVDTRFYLASPCKANLAIVKTKCPCWAKDGTITPEGEALEKYGKVPILDYSLKEKEAISDISNYESAIKECVDKKSGFKGLWATLSWDSPIYSTDCIVVNPVPLGNTWDGEINFCYGGSHNLAELSQIGVLFGTVASSVGAEVLFTAAEGLTSPTGVLPFALEAVNGVVNTAIDLAGAWMINEITQETKWPNH